jgi:hypothetical protein
MKINDVHWDRSVFFYYYYYALAIVFFHSHVKRSLNFQEFFAIMQVEI